MNGSANDQCSFCCVDLDDTGETVVVRGCALDSGTLTTDTEIIRMSHCGGLFFDDRYWQLLVTIHSLTLSCTARRCPLNYIIKHQNNSSNPCMFFFSRHDLSLLNPLVQYLKRMHDWVFYCMHGRQSFLSFIVKDFDVYT